MRRLVRVVISLREVNILDKTQPFRRAISDATLPWDTAHFATVVRDLEKGELLPVVA